MRRIESPTLVAWAAAFVGLIGVISASTPEMADRFDFVRGVLPQGFPTAARVLTLAFGLALLWLSRGLARRKRRAWELAVVLVVSGDRDDDVGRPLNAGALEREELGRVALVHLVLELALELVEAPAALLDQRHLVTCSDQCAGEVRADLAAARNQDVHLANGPFRRTHRVGQGRDRARSRTDDVEAA